MLNGYDFLILCNPNNPTSSAILKDEMRALLSFCANRDIFVMIDETYVEFAPSVQEVTAIPYTKEFSSILGIAGIVICGIYVVATCTIGTGQDIAMALFTAIVQGILVAGLSNYVNQLIKQSGKEE